MTNEEKVAYATAHMLQNIIRTVDDLMPVVLENVGMRITDEELLHDMRQGFLAGMLEQMAMLSKLKSEQWDQMAKADLEKEFQGGNSV